MSCRSPAQCGQIVMFLKRSLVLIFFFREIAQYWQLIKTFFFFKEEREHEVGLAEHVMEHRGTCNLSAEARGKAVTRMGSLWP